MGNAFSTACPSRRLSQSCSEENIGAEDNLESAETYTRVPWKGVEIPCDDYWRGSVDSLGRFWPLIVSYALEAYEQSLYSLAINAIKFNFFANNSEAAWLCYAIPYFFRPLGGLTGGWLSDQYGRKIVVVSSAYAMVATTVAQGLIPSGTGMYGIVALITLRMLQGLAYGSVASLAVYTVEVFPKQSIGKGLMFMGIGKGLGGMICTFIYGLLEESFDTAAMYAWGWRVPYLLVLLPGLISAAATHGLPESSEVEGQEVRVQTLTFWEATTTMFTDYGLHVVLYVGLCMTNASIGVIASSYLVDWLPEYTGLSTATATWIVLLNGVVTMVASPYTAYMTDTLGPSRLMLFGYGTTMVLTIPLFAFALYGPNALAAGVLMSVVFGCGAALGIPATFVGIALFPPELRAMSSGLLHNTEQCVFNGLSPAFVTWLCEYSALAPAYYLFATEVITVAAVVGLLYARRRGAKMFYLREIPF